MHQRLPSGIVYVSSRHQRLATASFGTLALRARLIPVLAGRQIGMCSLKCICVCYNSIDKDGGRVTEKGEIANKKARVGFEPYLQSPASTWKTRQPRTRTSTRVASIVASSDLVHQLFQVIFNGSSS